MKKQSRIERKIKNRMKAVELPETAYFMKSESMMRLCHIEHGKFQYLSFPFCHQPSMQTAAQLLVDCGIVDGFKAVTITDEIFYVELYCYRKYQHTDRHGKSLWYSVKKPVEWTDLKLTQQDVKYFIARYELAKPVVSSEPIMPPVISNKQIVAMFPKQYLNAA